MKTSIINGSEVSRLSVAIHFKSYEEACDDAKKIIDDHPDIKKMFSAI